MLISKEHQSEIMQFVDDKIYIADYARRGAEYWSSRSKTFQTRTYELYLRCCDYQLLDEQKRFIVIARVILASDFIGKGHFSDFLNFLESINPFDGIMIEMANPSLQKIAGHLGFNFYEGSEKGMTVYRLKQ